MSFQSIEIEISSEAMEPSPKRKKYDLLANPDAVGGDKKNVTFRQVRRTNTIIEAVRQYRVIDDPTKLFKMILENEAAEGYSSKMDKKSLLRLLMRLADEGQIKNIVMKLRFGEKSKVLHFVCEPNVEETHDLITSVVEQAKMKFHIAKKLRDDDDDDVGLASGSVADSVQQVVAMSGDPNVDQKAAIVDEKPVFSNKYVTRTHERTT